MIGNSYPYKDSGYSILEKGEINPRTFELDISVWVVCDRGGEELGEFPDRDSAEAFIEDQLKA